MEMMLQHLEMKKGGIEVFPEFYLVVLEIQTHG